METDLSGTYLCHESWVYDTLQAAFLPQSRVPQELGYGTGYRQTRSLRVLERLIHRYAAYLAVFKHRNNDIRYYAQHRHLRINLPVYV